MGAPLSSETLQTSYRVKITKRGSRGGVKTLKLASKMWIPLCFLLIHFLAKNGCFASSGGCYNPQNNGEDYRGTKSVTLSGKTCQKWAKQKPHAHEYPPKDYPELEENYCRNPYGGAEGGPWCYTTESDIRWEYCLTPCTGTGLTEVKFEGGSANATNELNQACSAEKAFILGATNADDAWHNGKEILTSIVWYEFQIKIVPGRVSFRGREKMARASYLRRSSGNLWAPMTKPATDSVVGPCFVKISPGPPIPTRVGPSIATWMRKSPPNFAA